MSGASAYYAQNRAEFGENITRYYELIREQDLCLTHTLVNPQRHRRPAQFIPDDIAQDVALKVVKETDAGLIVRGSRVCWRPWAP